MKFHLAVLLLASVNIVNGQTPLATPSATQLYRQSQVVYKKASELEQKGKLDKAIQSYEEAARLGDSSWSAAEQAGLPDEQRPPFVYYNPGIAHLDAARLLARRPADLSRMDEHCQHCILDLGRAAAMESYLARKNGVPINPNVWKINNAAAYALFLRGDLAHARDEYHRVLARNPDYRPAQEAIAQISKLEQKQNSRFTPQGDTSQKIENRQLIIKVIDNLKLGKEVFDVLKSLR